MLNAELLVSGYTQGIFPMADSAGTVSWYRPDPRGILPLEDLHVPRSLARTIRAGRYQVCWNRDFPGMLEGCSGRESTWLDDQMKEAVTELRHWGLAHSVECWDQDGLAGGLYGIALGGVFFGESMFSARRDASKVALVALVERMRACGFQLLDVQWSTPHLARFGVVEISASEFLERLLQALDLTPRPLPPDECDPDPDRAD